LPIEGAAMAVQGLQQVDALISELAQLERREREVSHDRARLHEDTVTIASSRRPLLDERRALHERPGRRR
jgi:hypothetical protein